MENHAFLRSYDSDPHLPPFPPLPAASCLSFSVFLCVAGRELTDGREGGGDGRGAKSYDREKAWPSLNHSIISEYSNIYIIFLHNNQLNRRTVRTHAQVIRGPLLTSTIVFSAKPILVSARSFPQFFERTLLTTCCSVSKVFKYLHPIQRQK